MTRDEARELARIAQAYADGKTVQWWGPLSDKWLDYDGDEFLAIGALDLEWRIKPEPREFWLVYYPDGTCNGLFYRTKSDATKALESMNRRGDTFAKLVHTREVLP